jgi:hypothetical protein
MCRELGEAGKDCVMLVKPVHPANLLNHVDEVLKRRALQTHNHSQEQSLYAFLSSVVRGGEVPAGNLTARQRPGGADGLA